MQAASCSTPLPTHRRLILGHSDIGLAGLTSLVTALDRSCHPPPPPPATRHRHARTSTPTSVPLPPPPPAAPPLEPASPRAPSCFPLTLNHGCRVLTLFGGRGHGGGRGVDLLMRSQSAPLAGADVEAPPDVAGLPDDTVAAAGLPAVGTTPLAVAGPPAASPAEILLCVETPCEAEAPPLQPVHESWDAAWRPSIDAWRLRLRDPAQQAVAVEGLPLWLVRGAARKNPEGSNSGRGSGSSSGCTATTEAWAHCLPPPAAADAPATPGHLGGASSRAASPGPSWELVLLCDEEGGSSFVNAVSEA